MFKSRLSQLRIKKGLNMKETASLLELPYTTYVGYEKGEREPDSEKLIRLADFFCCSVDYLLYRSDDPIDYANPEYLSNAPLDVIEGFDNMQKIAELQKTVDEDCNREFYIGNELYHNLPVTYDEDSLLSKYRKLDAYGKKAVDGLIETEYERCTSEEKAAKPKNIKLVMKAARDGESPGIAEITDEEEAMINNIPDIGLDYFSTP